MSDSPVITASVCSYNGGQDLLDCVAALRRQTVPLARIIVYDNRSDDDSVARLREEHPDVDVVVLEKNAGPCAARNRALAECEGDWLLQVDHDVLLEERCVERLWAEVQRDPGAVAWMPRCVFDHEPDRIHYDGGSFHYVGILSLRNFFQPIPAEDEDADARDVDAVVATAILMRRERVLEVGGYDPGYFILFEDGDLSYRLRARGERLRLVPRARVRHRAGTIGISYREGPRYPERRAWLHSRNRWRFLLRCYSTRALWVALPGILLYDLVFLVFAWRQGNASAWWRGKREAWAERQSLRAHARELAAERRIPERDLLRAPHLTHAPMVRQGAFARVAEWALDTKLRVWWWLAGWAVR